MGSWVLYIGWQITYWVCEIIVSIVQYILCNVNKGCHKIIYKQQVGWRYLIRIWIFGQFIVSEETQSYIKRSLIQLKMYQQLSRS